MGVAFFLLLTHTSFGETLALLVFHYRIKKLILILTDITQLFGDIGAVILVGNQKKSSFCVSHGEDCENWLLLSVSQKDF